MLEVRGLNSKGVAQFHDLINELKTEQDKTGLSNEKIEEVMQKCSVLSQGQHETVQGFSHFGVVDSTRVFYNKFDFFKYLDEDVFGEESPTVEIFSWLSVVFFRQLIKEKGKKRVGAIPNYISINSGRRAYKHLIRTPFLLYKEYTDLPKVAAFFKQQRLFETGEFFENWTARKHLCWDRTSTEVLFEIYVKEDGTVKKGASSKNKPGVVRNFGRYHKQLFETHSIADMSPAYLLSILPEQFERFKNEVEKQPTLF